MANPYFAEAASFYLGRKKSSIVHGQIHLGWLVVSTPPMDCDAFIQGLHSFFSVIVLNVPRRSTNSRVSKLAFKYLFMLN